MGQRRASLSSGLKISTFCAAMNSPPWDILRLLCIRSAEAAVSKCLSRQLTGLAELFQDELSHHELHPSPSFSSCLPGVVFN